MVCTVSPIGKTVFLVLWLKEQKNGSGWDEESSNKME